MISPLPHGRGSDIQPLPSGYNGGWGRRRGGGDGEPQEEGRGRRTGRLLRGLDLHRLRHLPAAGPGGLCGGAGPRLRPPPAGHAGRPPPRPARPGLLPDRLHRLARAATGRRSVLDDFPLPIEEPVSYCGFNSPKSYGGSSYFLQHPAGNWLIDSPKFLPRLVRQFEQRGGVANIFLTHSDDVADAERYAERFGSRRYHPPGGVARSARRRGGPRRRGTDPAFPRFPGDPDAGAHGRALRAAVPAPLPVHRRSPGLGPPRPAAGGVPRLLLVFLAAQTESMQRLAAFPFEWVLPGHGQRVHLPEDEMRRQVEELAARMRGSDG